MSAHNSTGIYTGVWTNWSNGRIAGSTLTLSVENGALLIAFLAFFITVVASALWKIFTYFLFHLLSAKAPRARDGLYHQRQAILRNSTNPLSALFNLARSGWAWRRNAKGVPRRMIPLTLFTALAVALFALGSGFSSKIATSISAEALVSGPVCLSVTRAISDSAACFRTDDSSLTEAINEAELMNDLAIYAKECYGDRPVDSMTPCDQLVKPKLTIHSDTDASCPFNNSLCRTNHSNIFLDTGLLDSQDDLGLNSPPAQRFLYRTTAHCAPLNTEGYSTLTKWTTQHDDVTQMALYSFGGISGKTNHTFMAPFHWHPPSPMGSSPRYLLGMSQWWPDLDRCYAGWIPIEELQLPDALHELIWLTADGIMYGGPVFDAWFNTSSAKERLAGGMAVHIRNEPASPMACIQREQYCNPNLPQPNQCTPLTDQHAIKNLTLELWKNDTSFQDTMKWVMSIKDRTAFSLGEITSALGDASLLSARSINAFGLQKALPATQWQAEVRFWFSIKLSGLQRMFVSLSKAPDATSKTISETLPANVGKLLCKNQKILSAAHTSFDFACLLATLLAGLLVIVLANSLDSLYKIYARCRRRRKTNTSVDTNADTDADTHVTGSAYAQLEWWASDTLQLQRLAHELVGSGTWAGSKLDGRTPVTTGVRGERLAALGFGGEGERVVLAPKKQKKVSYEKDDEDDDEEMTLVNDEVVVGSEKEAGAVVVVRRKPVRARSMSV